MSLAAIRAAFEADVAAMTAKYPAQKLVGETYAKQAREMRLGVLGRRVRTKLHDFPRGTVVAFVADGEREIGARGAMVESVAIYAPGLSWNGILTSVPAEIVHPTCTTCEGTGAVHAHPTALVATNCPACR